MYPVRPHEPPLSRNGAERKICWNAASGEHIGKSLRQGEVATGGGRDGGLRNRVHLGRKTSVFVSSPKLGEGQGGRMLLRGGDGDGGDTLNSDLPDIVAAQYRVLRSLGIVSARDTGKTPLYRTRSVLGGVLIIPTLRMVVPPLPTARARVHNLPPSSSGGMVRLSTTSHKLWLNTRKISSLKRLRSRCLRRPLFPTTS